MAAIDADRIKANDRVDPYLSTYEVPDPIKAPMRIVRLHWRGMIPVGFIDKTWTDLWQVHTWDVLSASKLTMLS